jgi:hypothetical protein
LDYYLVEQFAADAGDFPHDADGFESGRGVEP